MVRRVRQNSLVSEIVQAFKALARWLLSLLGRLAHHLVLSLGVTARVFSLLVRPKSPDNLFTAKLEPSEETNEASAAEYVDVAGTERRRTLLWVADPATASIAETSALSLWRGERTLPTEELAPETAVVNRRFAYLDLMAAQIRRLAPDQVQELDHLVGRLARKWLDTDETFEQIPRRSKLDVGRTLRYNIGRYAGRILEFQWATKELPVPTPSKPARILVIGDVSHSMVHYMSVLLYFFHKLNFRFVVDSYVFSDKATHATPYLNGLGTFEEKVKRLMEGAKSWNSGTRFGTALEEVAPLAHVDEYTYVIIATDGKVSTKMDQVAKIDLYMKPLKSRAKQVIFLTPSAEFSEGAKGNQTPDQLGSFRYEFVDIPIFNAGPSLWYGILGQYADRIYLVQTVQDLIQMTEDLIEAARR